MAKLKVSDNQWWFSANPLPGNHQNCRFIVLSIDGRECPMMRSKDGADGRPTFSFKFMNAEDRKLWQSLSGQEVEAAVLECTDDPPDLDMGFGDDATEVPLAARRVEAGPARTATAIHRSSATHFDAYLFIDWSANSVPKRGKDSIWIAGGHYQANGQLEIPEPLNPSTRAEAVAELRATLKAHLEAGRRVLVGLDFPFGYPRQAYSALLRMPSWTALWGHLSSSIRDDAGNKNNRFEVASNLNATSGQSLFWGCPTAQATAHLSTTKGQGRTVTEYRVVEQKLRASRRKAFAVWQLFGNGSVGSQAFLGIPRVRELRQEARARGLVWPFETGLKLPDRDATSVVWAEIWPGCIPYDASLHATRDAAQMIGYVRWAAEHDVHGDLSTYFELPGISGPERQTVAADEGWILGFKP